MTRDEAIARVVAVGTIAVIAEFDAVAREDHHTITPRARVRLISVVAGEIENHARRSSDICEIAALPDAEIAAITLTKIDVRAALAIARPS